MKTLYFVLLVCLVGCAANQSAIPFPEPALTPTGTGLPEFTITGDAQPERPALSPNKRILPPSKEPGVWAADGDPTLAGPKIGVILAATIIRFPDELETVDERAPVEFCAASMERAIGRWVRGLTLGVLSSSERECLAARLLLHCANELDKRPGTRGEQEGRAKARLFAIEYKIAKCGSGIGSDTVQTAVETTVLQWQRGEGF